MHYTKGQRMTSLYMVLIIIQLASVILTSVFCTNGIIVDAADASNPQINYRNILIKRRTSDETAEFVNGIIKANRPATYTIIYDQPVNMNCSCTFREDVRQLSCTDFPSSAALIRALNSPQFWCNRSAAVLLRPTSVLFPDRNVTSEYRGVRRVFIARSSLENFTFDALKRFDSLNAIALNRNNFGESGGPSLIEGFQLTTVIELDLADNYNLTQLRSRLLTTFPRLQTLRLDRNNLTRIEYRFFADDIVPNLRNISMKGNPWRCQEISTFIDWLRFNASTRVVLEDSEQTGCQSCDQRHEATCFQSVTWDNFIERCPHNCTCFMVRAILAVDCRNMGYYDFPAVVPSDVGVLYMQNNSVRSLHTLKSAKFGYLNIRFLYLDNNSIDSINGLDGTNFEELTMLHLNGNQLSKLSVHVFEKLFARKLDIVKLGNNPWSCECNTVVPFNDLLNSRRKRFQDIDQIRCSSNSTLHSNQPIHRLSPSDFCSQTSSIHPLDIINVLLATIIVFIVAKLLYDYRVFKRTGQIPDCPFINVCSRKAS